MKKSFLFIVVLSFFIISSCNHASTINIQESEGKKSVEEIAQKHITYKYVWNNFENHKSAISDEIIYPDFLYCLEIYDLDGNPIKFEDYSDKEKEQFFTAWKNEEVNHCINILKNDEELLEQVILDNEAMEEALNEAQKSAYINNSYEVFLLKYLNARKRLVNVKKNKNIITKSAAVPYGGITSDCLNPDSVQKLKSIYKKGLVLYTSDAASSSESYFGGHAAITSEETWRSDWESNGLAKISISAWGDSSPVWEGKTNGVQKEPLGFWAGTSESSARNVKVLQMRYSRIVIRFWFIFPYLALDYVNAPSGDADRAVLYAESQIGKPYDIGSDICATILDPTLIFQILLNGEMIIFIVLN